MFRMDKEISDLISSICKVERISRKDFDKKILDEIFALVYNSKINEARGLAELLGVNVPFSSETVQAIYQKSLKKEPPDYGLIRDLREWSRIEPEIAILRYHFTYKAVKFRTIIEDSGIP